MARKLRYQLENVCYHVVTRIAHREFFFDDVEKEIVHKLSYNIYCNFTNYGSALQSWALNRAIEGLAYRAKLID